MRFAKMHGLGNDFVLLDLRGQAGAEPLSPQRATELCDRHRGIGAERELAGGFSAVPVSTGNPHRVIFAEGELRVLAARHGPALCRAEDANIEFVSRLGPARYAAVVWERGAGLTQACGTGACAVSAAAISRGEAPRDEDITVELPGGALTIRVDARDRVRMRGPAELVFLGELPQS